MDRRTIVICLIIGICFSISFVSTMDATGSGSTSSWASYRGNSNNTGLSTDDTSGVNGTLKWEYEHDLWSYTSQIESSPVIDSKGNIYIGTSENGLVALNSRGSIKWEFNSGLYAYDPIIGPDGTIYVSSNKTLYALNRSGSPQWSPKKEPYSTSPSAIGHDGSIFCKNYKTLYSLHPNGTEKWSFSTGDFLRTPTILEDKSIIIGSGEQLYSLYPNGSTMWNISMNDSVSGPPVIGSDGMIYVSTWYGFHALYSNGTRFWNLTFEYGSTPALGPDGTIYLSIHGTLKAFDNHGIALWNFTAENGLGSPAVGADGTIFISENKRIYSIDTEGKENWNYSTRDNLYGYPAIANDGTVFFASEHEVLAFENHGNSGLTLDVDSPDPAVTQFSSSISITGTASDNAALRRIDYSYDGKNWHKADGLESWSAYVTLSSGNHDVHLRAVDIYWNTLETTHRITVNDDTDPFIQITSPTTDAEVSYGHINVNGTASDNGVLRYIAISTDERNWHGCRGTTSWSGELPLKPGDNTIYARAVDVSGNKNVTSIDVYARTEGITKPHWPSSRGGPQNTGQTPYDLSHLNGSLRWSKTDTKRNYGRPVVAADGTIYVTGLGTNSYYSDYLNAIGPDGATLWTFTADDPTDPTIGDDGTIYFSCDEHLYALYPNGTVKWDYSMHHPASPITLGDDGTLFFAGSHWNYYSTYQSHDFFAINPNGTLKWKLYSNTTYRAIAPVIAGDGTIITLNQTDIIAIDLQGRMKWNHSILSHFYYPSITIGPNEMIYLTGEIDNHTSFYNFFALNPDGTLKWSDYLHNDWMTDPAIGIDGTLYIGTYNGVHEIRPNGTRKLLAYGNQCFRPPVVGSDRSFISGFRSILHIDQYDTNLWAYDSGGTSSSTVAIGPGGVVYFSTGTTLYSLGDNTPPSLNITSPDNDQYFGDDKVQIISGTASDDTLVDLVEVSLDGIDWMTCYGTDEWQTQITLNDGPNKVYVRATDTYLNSKTTMIKASTSEYEKPTIQIMQPSNKSTVTSTKLIVRGYARDDGGIVKVEISLDGSTWIPCPGVLRIYEAGSNTYRDYNWEGELDLDEGKNTVYARATDRSGNTETATITINTYSGTTTQQEEATTDSESSTVFGLGKMEISAMIIVFVILIVLAVSVKRNKGGPRKKSDSRIEPHTPKPASRSKRASEYVAPRQDTEAPPPPVLEREEHLPSHLAPPEEEEEDPYADHIEPESRTYIYGEEEEEEVDDTPRCPSCEEPIDEDAKFCSGCGQYFG